MERLTRVVVLGDEGCGKTALIWRVVSSQGGIMPPELDAPADPAALPSFPHTLEDYVIETVGEDGHHDVVLVDTSCDEEDMAAKLSPPPSVAIVCVDSASVGSFYNTLRERWLPLLTVEEGTVPVLLCVTKMDLYQRNFSSGDGGDGGGGGAQATTCETVMDRIVLDLEHTHHIACEWIGCSALHADEAVSAVKAAVDMVLCPMYPLYNRNARCLHPKVEAALNTVFQRCDQDGDGALSDDELRTFQRTVFNVELPDEKLAEIKQAMPHGCYGHTGLLCAGFLHLHTLMASMRDSVTIWKILRHYRVDAGVCPDGHALFASMQSSITDHGPSGGGEDLSISSTYVKVERMDASYYTIGTPGAALQDGQAAAAAPGGGPGGERPRQSDVHEGQEEETGQTRSRVMATSTTSMVSSFSSSFSDTHTHSLTQRELTDTMDSEVMGVSHPGEASCASESQAAEWESMSANMPPPDASAIELTQQWHNAAVAASGVALAVVAGVIMYSATRRHHTTTTYSS